MTGARLSTTPAGIRLCALDEIPAGTARNFVVQLEGGRFHGFVVRRGDEIIGYVDRCPHAGMPLAHELDEYLTPDGTLIQCDWHGALFEIEDGRCIAGPCKGAKLTAWPVAVKDDVIRTAAAPGEKSHDGRTDPA